MESKVIIAIINAIKDFALAGLDFLKGRNKKDTGRKKENGERIEIPPLTVVKTSDDEFKDQNKADVQNPFVPDINELKKMNITDEAYIEIMGTYLAADRNPEDLIINFKE